VGGSTSELAEAGHRCRSAHRSQLSKLEKSELYGMTLECVLTITVDFVHVLRRNANDAALLDDFGIFPYNAFHNLEIFHGDLH
jgi:hypothetical protein